MKTFTKLNHFAGIMAASVVLGAGALAAHAGPVTVAEFAALGSSNPFAFTNSGAASTFGTITPGTAAQFEYTTAANSYDGMAGVLIPATITITSSVSGTASQASLGSQLFDVQPMTDVVITITADTPVDGHSNLLTVTASPLAVPSSGLTYATDGSDTANLKGDSGNGDDVTLTSDFLGNLDTATRQSFSLEFTSVAPPLGINGNGYLDSFTSDGTGSFATDASTGSPGVPEPASIALLGLGALGTLVRRKSTRD